MTTTTVPLVPPVVLLGPPGAGKSSVGPLLARSLGFAFIDLDDVVGVQHLIDEGLASFRVREHLALIEQCRGAVVVAAGAGVADTGPAREFLRRCLCLVVDVDVDTALPRLRASGGRPWLGRLDDQRAQWLEREAQRPAWRAALAAGVVDGRRPLPEIAVALRALVDAFVIGCDAQDDVDDDLLLGPGFVVADAAVAARLPRCDLIIDVDDGKDLRQVERILQALARANPAKAEAVVVGVGGGALLDLVGLAAALFRRGTPWRAVPTTLLAMVDAALGGKTAVDLVVDGALLRNAAGVVHAPTSTCVWPGFLSTLSPAALRHGRAELIKHQLLAPAAEPHSNDDDIRRSRGVKRYVVDRDPGELHFRQALNLGHTFAHALESRCGLAHGDAVLHGLGCMLHVSVDVAGLDPSVAAGLRAFVNAATVPPLRLDDDDVTAVCASMQRDKKGAGRLVVLRAPGRPALAVVDDAVVRAALARI